MSETPRSHVITFTDVKNRVKDFRHKHCNRPVDEDIPLGFLAEMSYALGHENSFQLMDRSDSDEKSGETRLYELKRSLGNLYRFIENDGGVVSESNMEFLKSLMER
jgi:hypothetical protein